MLDEVHDAARLLTLLVVVQRRRVTGTQLAAALSRAVLLLVLRVRHGRGGHLVILALRRW